MSFIFDLPSSTIVIGFLDKYVIQMTLCRRPPGVEQTIRR